MYLARSAGLCFFFSLHAAAARLKPPRASLAPPPPSHCAATCAPPQPPHLATAQQPFSSAPPAQQLCAAACTRSRRRRHTTPSPPHESPSPSAAVLHAILVLRAAAPRRSHIRSTFSPSARQVLDVLPEPLFSHRVRVPHTVSQDGSRKEKGEGSRGREARSQADSRREGGREGRDGGQGRRGAGIRPCSSVPDQGGPQRQRQRQRQGHGQSERCQGHQSRDSSSSRVRSVRYSCRF